jgi:lysozyme
MAAAAAGAARDEFADLDAPLCNESPAMTLRLNSTGPDVKILQAALLAASFDPQGDDGHFGPDTEAAVKRFQAARGLIADGVVGDATARALGLVAEAPAGDALDEAAQLATSFEGFSATPYWDPNGRVWTYGFGSTRDLNNNPVTATTQPVSRIQAVGLMRRDMTRAATVVSETVRVPLTEHERAALDDFIYNVGEGNFEGSTLLRKLNAGDPTAADEFLKWNKSGGHVLAGLVRRRAAERAEFLKT